MEGVELEEVKHDQGTELRKQKAGILLWSSGLRIWHCYCSGSGGYSGVGSTLAPGTSTCRGMAKNKNFYENVAKKKKKQKTLGINYK